MSAGPEPARRSSRGMTCRDIVDEWIDILQDPFLRRFHTAAKLDLSVGFNPEGVAVADELLADFTRSMRSLADMMDKEGRSPSGEAERDPTPSLQARVSSWCQTCFGAKIARDRLERGDRLLEEVLELLQSGDYPPERVAAIRDYTWSRPKGAPAQEVGGVMITLAAYCAAHRIDMQVAAETEYHRISQPEVIAKIRAKQASKPTGSALPIPVPETHEDELLACAGAMAAALRARGERSIAAGGMPLDEDQIARMERDALTAFDALPDHLRGRAERQFAMTQDPGRTEG